MCDELILLLAMANIKVPCNCEQRQLNAALESEIIACKAVNVLQVQEAIKATVYLNLLQDEIGLFCMPRECVVMTSELQLLISSLTSSLLLSL